MRVLAVYLVSASCSPPQTNSTSSAGAWATVGVTSGAGAGGADAGTPLPIPTIAAPDGWHLWPWAPPDCAVFVPDDIASVPSLSWQTCPFMPDGCGYLDAPWAAQSGWGFGGLLGAAAVSGHTYLSLSKMVSPGWWESDIYEDDHPIGAWRSNIPDSACGANGPWLSANGFAALELVRFSAETSPIIAAGAPEHLLLAPDDIESFFPPGPALIPSGGVNPSPAVLAVDEQYGNLTVRWPSSQITVRPQPPGVAYQDLVDASPVGEAVLYRAFTGGLSSIWAVTSDGKETPLLEDASTSYDALTTDGQYMIWTRSTGYLGINQFQTIELWGSPAVASAAALTPKYLWTSPTHVIPRPAFGDGWAAIRVGIQDVRLVRAADFATRHLPVIPGYTWSEGQADGLAIAGGYVWAKAFPNDAAGNDVRLVVRLAIDKLPQP